jgi:hypothetical protein
MSGNPDNASVWDEGDVLVLFDPPSTAEAISALMPASIDADFGEDWVLAGLLDGSAGFADTTDEPVTKHRAWGAGVIKESRKGAEVNVTFTAIEDNETTERLGRPNLRESVLIAFVTTEDGVEKRKIARKPAKVRRNGAQTDNEDALSMKPFTASIFPDTSVDPADDDPFWLVQKTSDTGS